MSAKIKKSPRTSRNLLVLGVIAFSLTLLAAHAAAVCDAAIPLAPGETWRDPGGEKGGGTCFSVGLDSAGALVLELLVPAAAPRVRLSLIGLEEMESSAFRRLQQSATNLVLAGRTGNYRVRVAPEDPQQPLPPFRLHARFADHHFAASMAKSEHDGEIEIQPDPLVAEPFFPAPGCHVSKSEHDGEIEIQPDPRLATPRFQTLGSVASKSYDLVGVLNFLAPEICELCGQGGMDDHGDGFVCATALPLEEAVHGEIGNDWGDDSDVFRFHLAALATLELRAHGESKLVGELYDRHGLRLGTASGEINGLRLIRTLVPGTYFVRIEGRNGVPGRYSLNIGSPSWKH